eukprot:TRINITY_DN3861_c0_g1_i1.p1 TRINITY_DN3861_c0_g1~~TRINITY_DN3861_c0_g1_i1.p1  ORF type:complete len:627 (+),score=112.76 TRINITY_DN3861_c0_g1_i1:125-2005(+)
MDDVCDIFKEAFAGNYWIRTEKLAFVLDRLGLRQDCAQPLLALMKSDSDGRLHFGDFLTLLDAPIPDSISSRSLQDTLTISAGTYDLLVLGAGPVGVQGAVEAASRGYRVGIVDPKAMLTGAPTGTHSKCVREALLEGKRTWAEIQEMIARVQEDAQSSTARQLHTFHVDVLRGTASFVDETTLCFTSVKGDSRNLVGKSTIIATGSRANRLPMVNFDLPGVFDSDTIGNLDYLPKKLVVQGGGIVGLEYAVMFAMLGAQVVVIEFFDKILQMLDVDLQKSLISELEEYKVELLLKTGINAVEADEGSSANRPALRVKAGDRIIPCDCFLSATGRGGCVKGLALENVGIKPGRGNMIAVDDNQHTGVGNIYAAGDVVGGNLATVGISQAARAVRKMFGSNQYSLKDREIKPFVVWSIPEVAWAGVNEQEAATKELNFGVVRVEYSKAVRGIVNKEKGYLKMIYNRDVGKVLGVHLCGNHASELINFGAEAINDGLTIYDILSFVFPAVTYHRLYSLAAQEAKLRIAGVKSLSAASAWGRIGIAIKNDLASRGSSMSLEDTVCDAFKAFDVSGSGFLDINELQSAMRSLGVELTSAEVEDMVHEAGASKGAVDYQEFIDACKIITKR